MSEEEITTVTETSSSSSSSSSAAAVELREATTTVEENRVVVVSSEAADEAERPAGSTVSVGETRVAAGPGPAPAPAAAAAGGGGAAGEDRGEPHVSPSPPRTAKGRKKGRRGRKPATPGRRLSPTFVGPQQAHVRPETAEWLTQLKSTPGPAHYTPKATLGNKHVDFATLRSQASPIRTKAPGFGSSSPRSPPSHRTIGPGPAAHTIKDSIVSTMLNTRRGGIIGSDRRMRKIMSVNRRPGEDRMLSSTLDDTPGPGAYSSPERTIRTPALSRSARDHMEREWRTVATRAPPPTSYTPRESYIHRKTPKYGFIKSPRLVADCKDKQYLSKDHTRPLQGNNSPGPIYNPSLYSLSLQSEKRSHSRKTKTTFGDTPRFEPMFTEKDKLKNPGVGDYTLSRELKGKKTHFLTSTRESPYLGPDRKFRTGPVQRH